MDIVAYLASKGLHGRNATGAEVTYPCFFDCAEPADSRKRKLYLNTETGMYECKVCLAKGGTTLLQRHFGDEPEKTPDAPRLSRRSAVLEATTRLGEGWLANDDRVLMYLMGQRRGLTVETIVARRLGYAPAGESIVDNLPLGEFEHHDLADAGIVHREGRHIGRDFFTDRVLIPYIADGRVVQVRGKDIDGRYYTGPGEAVRLYNVDALKGADDVIVVEGEFDCMILADLLAASPDPKVRRIAVVGLAGANAIPDDFDDRLAGAKRIFLGTDPDDTGRRAAERLKERIGSRARVLEWPETLLQKAETDGLALKELDWTTWIATYGAVWQDVADMLRAASGRRLATVAEAGAAFRNRPTTGGIKLGFAELDAWISPGLLPGQVMIPLAKTGTGKTVFLCNLAVNTRKRRTLFVSLEQTREEVYERLARVIRFRRPYLSDEQIADELSLILICDENRLNEQDFADLVEEYTDTVGDKPELVFIDYLGYYARGFRGTSNYEKSTAAVFQLKAEAKKHRVSIIVPGQVNRGAERGKALDLDDARDSGAIEETADFVLSLYRPDEAAMTNGLGAEAVPTYKLRSELLKSRHGNQNRVTTLQMGPLSLAIVDALGPDARKAAEEVWLVQKGVTYDRYLADLTAPVQMPLRRDLA